MSSHAVKAAGNALGNVMDARALNVEQTYLLVNTTPECDSLAEYIGRLVGHGVPPAEVADIATLIRKIAESNVAEGHCEMAAGGVLDDLARLTRAAELQHMVGRSLTVKSIARALRDPLRVIATPCAESMEFVQAVRTVDDIIERCTEQQLRSAGLRHELRERAFGVLGQMLDRRAMAA